MWHMDLEPQLFDKLYYIIKQNDSLTDSDIEEDTGD